MQYLSHPNCSLKVASINQGRFQYTILLGSIVTISQGFIPCSKLAANSCNLCAPKIESNCGDTNRTRKQRINYDLVLWNNVTDAGSGRHFLTTRSPISFRCLLTKPISDWPQLRHRLYGETLSRVKGSPSYPSYPGRADFSHIYLQNLANRLHDKKNVGSARRVTPLAGSPS